jgi:hypothetical protein
MNTKELTKWTDCNTCPITQACTLFEEYQYEANGIHVHAPINKCPLVKFSLKEVKKNV